MLNRGETKEVKQELKNAKEPLYFEGYVKDSLLDLSEQVLTGRASELLVFLASHPQITSLMVNSCQLNAHDVIFLARNTTLRKLDLRNNLFNDYIATVYLMNKSLFELVGITADKNTSMGCQLSQPVHNALLERLNLNNSLPWMKSAMMISAMNLKNNVMSTAIFDVMPIILEFCGVPSHRTVPNQSFLDSGFFKRASEKRVPEEKGVKPLRSRKRSADEEIASMPIGDLPWLRNGRLRR